MELSITVVVARLASESIEALAALGASRDIVSDTARRHANPRRRLDRGDKECHSSHAYRLGRNPRREGETSRGSPDKRTKIRGRNFVARFRPPGN